METMTSFLAFPNLVLLLLSFEIVAGLPQFSNDGGIISELFCAQNYSCVDKNKCLCRSSNLEDEYPQIDVRLETDCFLDELEVCSDADEVCCPFENVLPREEVMPDSGDCKDISGYSCVPNHLCRNGQIITDGEGVITIRQALPEIISNLSKCQGSLEVCCRNEDITVLPNLPTPIPSGRKCGKRKKDGVVIRMGGQNKDLKEATTQFGEWPHMCVLFQSVISSDGLGTNNIFQCGASLITPGVVLTAAHCVNSTVPLNAYMVRCGDWDLKTDQEPLDHQDRFIDHVSVHPRFNPKNVHNDFALLHMSAEFDLDQHINPICLPSGDQSYESQKCFASGWGKDSYENGEYQTVMQKVELPLVEHQTCENLFKQTRLGIWFRLDKSFICAGGQEGLDTCKGDGGGPLVCPYSADPDTFVQTGIVAWGIGCGQQNVPGAYASVEYGLCFIQWAINCRHGKKYRDFINLDKKCENFIEREISLLNKKIALENSRQGFTSTIRNGFRSLRKLEKIQSSLDKAVEMQQKCIES